MEFDKSLEPKQDNTTITELKSLVDEMYKTKKLLDDHDKKHKELKAKIMNIMNASDVQKFEGTDCKISLIAKSSVTVPKDNEGKNKLFNYISQKYNRDTLVSLLTINSNAFNAFYNREIEALNAAGNFEPKIDGVGAPYDYTTLSVRKKS